MPNSTSTTSSSLRYFKAEVFLKGNRKWRINEYVKSPTIDQVDEIIAGRYPEGVTVGTVQEVS